jgi:hypothetical protein
MQLVKQINGAASQVVRELIARVTTHQIPSRSIESVSSLRRDERPSGALTRSTHLRKRVTSRGVDRACDPLGTRASTNMLNESPAVHNEAQFLRPDLALGEFSGDLGVAGLQPEGPPLRSILDRYILLGPAAADPFRPRLV